MTPTDVVAQYGAAVAAGDMAALAATLHERAVWHQPGRNPLSGDHVGPQAIVAHLGGFMERSGGTFRLETLTSAEVGTLVATTVRFSATREGRRALDQGGVDVFRVEGDRIVEIWLIGEDQDAEDAFWR